MHADFRDDIVAVLPKLRLQALAMTRNRADAEDLVQDSVTNALAAEASFQPGTHFNAWMHRIVRNRFITTVRRRRPTVDLDDAPAGALSRPAGQVHAVMLTQVAAAMDRLPEEGRRALEMLALDGMTYEEISEATGFAIGTGKSRVFRARRLMEAWIDGPTQ